MNTPSMKDLEKSLKSYSLDVDYWDYDFGEGHLMQGNREFLERWKGLLSNEQLIQLAAIDKKAKALLDAYHGKQTIDVWNLNNVVNLINKTLPQSRMLMDA